jgi:hypothetical protein
MTNLSNAGVLPIQVGAGLRLAVGFVEQPVKSDVINALQGQRG